MGTSSYRPKRRHRAWRQFFARAAALRLPAGISAKGQLRPSAPSASPVLFLAFKGTTLACLCHCATLSTLSSTCTSLAAGHWASYLKPLLRGLLLRALHVEWTWPTHSDLQQSGFASTMAHLISTCQARPLMTWTMTSTRQRPSSPRRSL